MQAQVINMLMELKKSRGLTYLAVAHDLSVVRYLSDRVAVMYLGQIVEIGTVEDIYERPLHVYTRGLLDAVPLPIRIMREAARCVGLRGEVVSPVNPKPGCRFAGRCPRDGAVQVRDA